MLSNEQWIIYIYGLLPNRQDGFVAFIVFVLVILTIVKFVVNIEGGVESKIVVAKIPLKGLTILAGVILTIGAMLPSKQTFLMMWAVPTVVDSIKNGKLSKLNDVFDKALDKALLKLNKEE